MIASILTDKELIELITLGKKLGMDALVEVHTGEDLKKAVNAGADIIGINNRNLKDLTVDMSRAKRLIPHVPKGTIPVVESGITTHDDLMEYKSLGVNAFLIGTILMMAPNVMTKIQSLLGTDRKWRKAE